jgi:hypothetical protein
VKLIRLVVGAKIFAVIRAETRNRGAYHARISLVGVHDDHERRNLSKIRFYGEIFEVNFCRAASAEKFMRRLQKRSSSREKNAKGFFGQGERVRQFEGKALRNLGNDLDVAKK